MTTLPDHLQGMTQRKWDALTPAQRGSMRSWANLTTQLIGLEGDRVEVVTTYGETRRFWVGRSTGWAPCHIEVHNSRNSGGPGAEREYQSVKVIRKGPRR
jgi:hypothetical protein